MSRAETGSAPKQALASAERSGVGRAYPAAIRERAIAYVGRRRAEGVADEAIGRELGISPMTFRRWVGARPSAFTVATVVEPAPAAPSGPLVVQGPRGLRIEGLDLAGVVELWERLS
jgi:hypothetical protein